MRERRKRKGKKEAKSLDERLWTEEGLGGDRGGRDVEVGRDGGGDRGGGPGRKQEEREEEEKIERKEQEEVERGDKLRCF